jgi:alpha-glucosidase
MGCEISNYHGPYRYFVADYGDLDYYFIASMTTPFTAVKRFTWLTGRPALMPRWSLGYSGSTMSYTDASNAQQQMAGFIDQCRRHDILCESFHLSSGYTSIASKRYVFNWNRDKFPDIDAFVRQYRENGIRLVANIKPCLLMDHPDIDEVIDRQFWGDIGAYLDFTNPDTIDWWKSKVTDCLLRFGITSTWNDNNEFEILSPKAMAHNFGRPCAACEIKPLQALAMMRASRDAQRDYAPDIRPFVVTRSGAVGMLFNI